MKSKKVSRSASSPSAAPATREQIAALAHAIWIDRGRPDGRDVDHWLEAERQLQGETRTPLAADDIPADGRALDADAALEGPLERELNTTPAAPPPRSPTSL